MYARNPLDEAEQAPVDALPVAGCNVMSLSLVRVTKRLRLSGREVSTLLGGKLEELLAAVTSIDRHQPKLK